MFRNYQKYGVEYKYALPRYLIKYTNKNDL